jgi:predicted Zn-ribbon and HTH transcriptional regulator
VSKTAEDIRREHPLATEDGLQMFVNILAYMGALCPKCGFGTRKTSKRWARCKKCNERVERRELPQGGSDAPHG